MKLNPPATFATLLRRIDAEVGKAMRVRFTTSHPKDVTAELIEAMATLPCVCEHIHLPVQAGSTRTLRRMERGYTREEYIEKVSALRNAIPSLAISTDIIVGFPGESESDFADTLSLMRELAFDASFAFKFSPRPNTPAADYADQIPEAVRAERLAQVLALQDESSLQKNQELIGQTAEVLVDRELRKRDTGLAAGRTRQNRIVHFRGGEIEEGVLASVQITGATAHHLKGVLTASS
jgi:tRNA-2-methylthio-N6-dimethylallyladenosine synthase